MSDLPTSRDVPVSPSQDSWSSKSWGSVAAAIVALLVLGAALAIVVQVGRGPGDSESSSESQTAAHDSQNRIPALTPEHRPSVSDLLSTARLRAAEGDLDAAVEAYERLVRPETDLSYQQPVSSTVALFELGELEAKRGNTKRAIELLQQYLDFRGDADIESPTVATARRRLAELREP